MPAGVIFNIADRQFTLVSRVRIVPANYTGAAAASDVVTVTSYPVATGQYAAAVPVSCTTAGRV